MNNNLRPFQAEERSDHGHQQARVSELLVAYFLRGIRSLDALPRGEALATREAWSVRRLPQRGRRAHPWAE